MIAAGVCTVPAKLKYGITLFALICLAHAWSTRKAVAITVEVAKKCGTLADKAYPSRVPGNPAAGRANGTTQAFRDYFNKCVTNGGNMDGQTSEPENNKNNPVPAKGDNMNGQAPQQAK
jgi:hypothetical protein